MIHKQKGGFEPLTLAAITAYGTAKAHGLGAALAHHGHLHALHSSLLLHTDHINNVIHIIHPKLHLSNDLLLQNVHVNSLHNWLQSSKLSIEHFLDHLIERHIVHPAFTTIKLTGEYIYHDGNLTNALWNSVIGIIFMKVIPKVILVLTGKIPIYQCYTLFGWESNTIVHLDKYILDEVKSYTRDYTILSNAINHGNEYIDVIVSEHYISNSIQDVITEFYDIGIDIDKIDLFIQQIQEIQTDDIAQKVSEFLIRLDKFLLDTITQDIYIEKIYKIYGIINNLLVYQSLIDKSMETNITCLDLLRMNVFNDFVEQLMNQIVIFSVCSEIYTIFGVHGVHFVKTYIAQYFVTRGVITQLVDMKDTTKKTEVSENNYLENLYSIVADVFSYITLLLSKEKFPDPISLDKLSVKESKRKKNKISNKIDTTTMDTKTMGKNIRTSIKNLVKRFLKIGKNKTKRKKTKRNNKHSNVSIKYRSKSR